MPNGSDMDAFRPGVDQTSVPGMEQAAAAGGKVRSSVPTPADIALGNFTAPALSADEVAKREKQAKRKRDEAFATASKLYVEELRDMRRRRATIAAVCIIVSVMSLFINAGYASFFSIDKVFGSYALFAKQLVAQLTDTDSVLTGNELMAYYRNYFTIINRIPITLMTIICGAILAIAGTLYQSAFRNPIASPSMLGVSSAIQMGDVIIVLIYGTAAANYLSQRYLICYACVIAVMIALFVFARLMSGKGRSMNVVNLLLIATVLTQLIGVFVTYATNFIFDDELWEVYNSLSEAITVNTNVVSWVALLVTCAVGVIPIICMRFRLNGLNFPDSDMKVLGINATRLRLVALVCGTVLLMAAQVQMGTVAMLSLVVPHISRMIFGAEFRKQFVGNVLLGATLLVVCRDVVGFIPVLGNFLPVSLVLNFIILPFFVWMLATQQRGWEQ